MPQWSPVMKTGNTRQSSSLADGAGEASMEPGHEDREYVDFLGRLGTSFTPQWSPVMKTGNTRPNPKDPDYEEWPQWSPVMKTGNTPPGRPSPSQASRLNGARS